jgi:hypothetical protein
MKSILFSLAMILGLSPLANAYEPFKCLVQSSDKTVDTWLYSTPIQGHGLEHWAYQSFKVTGQIYTVDAQAVTFTDKIGVRISSGSYIASANNELTVGTLPSESLTVICQRVK